MKNKNVMGIVIGLVILVVSGALGNLTGVFNGFGDITRQIKLSPDNLIKVLVVVGLLYAVNSLLQLLFGMFKSKKGRASTLSTVIASLAKYVIVLIGFCWVLTLIGVNVSTIFASVGIVALILGFGAESLVADVVTGVFILFENQFNVGDIIEVDGFRGTVDSIGIRTIALRDTGGNVKIINNANLSNIVNRSLQGSVAISEVGVSYDTDLDLFESKVEKMLQEIKEKRSDVFIGNIEYLGVEELAASNVVLKFKADVNEKDIFKGRRILNKELKCAFDREGIVIAYPQLDVHQK